MENTKKDVQHEKIVKKGARIMIAAPQSGSGKTLHVPAILAHELAAQQVLQLISAEYIYNGNRIRTSTVLQILKASDEFITFETLNSIYTISYLKVSAENRVLCA